MTFLDQIYKLLSDISLTEDNKALLLNYANKKIVAKTTVDNVENNTIVEILSKDELLNYITLINDNVKRNLKESMDDIEPNEAGVH